MRDLSDVVPVALVVLTKADGLLPVRPESTRDEVSSRMLDLRSEAIEDAGPAFHAKLRRAPCVVVAAESAFAARPNALAEQFVGAMGAWWERLDRERPALLALREGMRLRAGIAELAEAVAKERRSSQRRLATLEEKRFPEPAEFRRRLLDRVDGAIEKGADDVLAAAVARLEETMKHLRSEFVQQIESCTSRSELDTRIAALNETAGRRIADALEQTAEIVARELYDVTETLEVWAFEEIRTHYRLFQRLGAEALAPIASELTREDLELGSMQPFEAALETFEKQRVGYGLGGVAGGALIGTLIAPGIGTAVGAVIGVLAGLLKGTDSLKQECVAKIDACLTHAEGHARAQLKSKRPELARTILVTLDEALAEAFRRLNDAIERLRAVERRAMDGERAKIAEASAARDKLAECDERLARLLSAGFAAILS